MKQLPKELEQQIEDKDKEIDQILCDKDRFIEELEQQLLDSQCCGNCKHIVKAIMIRCDCVHDGTGGKDKWVLRDK